MENICNKCNKNVATYHYTQNINGREASVHLCKECLEKRNITPELPDVDQFATKTILLPLDSSALMAMKYCSEAKVNRLFNFSITDQNSMNFFSKAAETYLLNHLERGFNTLNFYKSVKD